VWGDHLQRLPIHGREGRAQHLMPADDLIQAPLQGRHIERPAQRKGGVDVVRRATGLELIEEPEPPPLACSMARASSSTVAASKTRLTGKSTRNASCIRAMTWVASRE
jgi:hypothetical protein